MCASLWSELMRASCGSAATSRSGRNGEATSAVPGWMVSSVVRTVMIVCTQGAEVAIGLRQARRTIEKKDDAQRCCCCYYYY